MIAMSILDFAATEIVQAIRKLYGIAVEVNDWMNDHIEKMKASENLTVSRIGKVLEGAKLGFGLGYIAPVIVVAVGQVLLGNNLAAVATVGTAATLSNPLAMTCAAVGAIYLGWNALSGDEKKDVLEKISAGLQVGIELIRAVVNFVIDISKDILTSKNLGEMKEHIRNVATVFGRHLGDVTGAIVDRVADAARATKDAATTAVETTAEGVLTMTKMAAESTTKAAGNVKRAAKRLSGGKAETINPGE